MSKSSTASATKNPNPTAKGAWSRGPPTAPSPRSQSPAPPPTPIQQTHSRRPSGLGPSVSIKDGVSVPKNNIGSVKQGSAVTFGSIDGAEAPVPSPPAIASKKSEGGIKSFGTVPFSNATTGHVNGKGSISSRASVVQPAPQAPQSTPSSSATPAVRPASDANATAAPATVATSTPAPTVKPKIDIKKMFQNPPSASSSNPPSDTSSPALRNSTLPGTSGPSTTISGPSGPGSTNVSQASAPSHPSQLAAHSYNFIPRQQGNASNGAGPPPRSPSFNRTMQNGGGPRNQGGPVGPNNPGVNPAMSSPRLGPPPPHNGAGQPGAPAGMPPTQQMAPHMQPGMPMAWPGYYYPPPEQQQYMYWYGHMPMAQHQPPPGQHGPMPPVAVHPGMPMSPRNPPSNLQNPGTPTMSHAHAVPTNGSGVMPSPHTHAHPLPHVQGPPHPHPHAHAHHPHGPNVPAPSPLTHPSTSLGGLSSPPPTPSTIVSPIPPVSAAPSPIAGRLNAGSSAFVPRKITLKTQDGVELDLGSIKGNAAQSPASATPYRQGSPGTAHRRPPSATVRIESEDARKLRLAEEEKKVEAEKKKKEEEERKVREEEEKKKRQKEDEERKIKEEEDRKIQEEERRVKEEERKIKEEEERKLKEEEMKIKEEEERKLAELKRIEEEKRKEEEEKEKLQREEEAKKKEEEKRIEEEKLKAIEEEKAKAEETERIRKAEEKEKEDGEITEDPAPLPQSSKEKAKEALRIDTTSAINRKHPGNLDLTDAKKSAFPAPQSALATARIISDITTVQYPEGVSSPRPDLNKDAKEGKFRYDRDFLLQFMSICKEKPASLPPLDAIGLEPLDPAALALTRGGSGRHRTASTASRPGVGLGISPSGLGKGVVSSFNGEFGAAKLTSQERFQASNRSTSVSGPNAQMQFAKAHPIIRSTSQGGATPRSTRTRSKRGGERNESNRVQGGSHPSAFGNNNYQNPQMANLEPVAPLQVSKDRWDPKALKIAADSPALVDRKVKSLLNKLTMEKFDSISDQIIAWANKSENESDGRTLIQVIKLVFEKATDEAAWGEMYARLCRKMMEQINPKVQDESIRNAEGKPIAGGQLFRKYLLNRCQEDFESGWKAKEATAKAAASKAKEDEAAKAENEKDAAGGKDEVALYSEEYYAAQKAKRQGLGLIKFIGELFKLQMLTERIMHECVKKLLGNVDNPEEEEIESLCKLLSTVGGILDTPKAKAHMDVYFSRMRELTKSLHVTSRMQFMLQDVIELRDRRWNSRQGQAVAAPTTLAAVHEAAAKDRIAQEKESMQRQMGMSRGGSRRGGDRSDVPQVGPDGWAVAGAASSAPRPPPKAGDLSQFGKIANTKGQPMTFGPSSVFAGKKGSAAAEKRESLSRTASSSNMFMMLENAGAAEKAAEPQQRKRIILAPRSKPTEPEAPEAASPAAESDASEDEPSTVAAPEMSEKEASKKLAEDIKEFFSVKEIDEGYFTDLPPKLRYKLVEEFTCAALEKKEPDALLLAKFFAHAVSKGACDVDAFEQGFSKVAEIVFDVAIDSPKALDWFAVVVKGAGLDEDVRRKIASKSEDEEKLVALFS